MNASLESTKPAAANAPGARPAEAKDRRYLRAGLAGGAGGLVTLFIVLLDQRPELARLLLDRVVVAWGPQFFMAVLLFAMVYVLADRYAPRLIAAQNDTALALQNLARAVERLLARDDAFQREQDVLLNHVARRVDALHRLVESRHRALNGHLSRLAGAGKAASARAPRPTATARTKKPATEKKVSSSA